MVRVLVGWTQPTWNDLSAIDQLVAMLHALQAKDDLDQALEPFVELHAVIRRSARHSHAAPALVTMLEAVDSREASRYASVHGSQSDHPVDQAELQTWVRGRAVGLTTSSITVALSWTPANDNNPGSEAIVKVSYNVLPMVGLVLRPITVAGLSKSVISH